MKKYRVVYADPPWEYKGKIGANGSNVNSHYNTMPIEKIKSLKVKEVIDDNAVLFLWTTDSYLKRAIDVMESWGFKYKTVAFVWVKLGLNKKPVTVPGPYTTKSSELCLLGIKGHVTKYIGTRPRQIVIKKREEHSKKPDVVRDRISKMFPNGPTHAASARADTESAPTGGVAQMP